MIMDIKQEHAAIEARLVAQPASYIDYDGSRMPLHPTDEQQKDMQRMLMLQDLMELRYPLHETEWGMDMHFGMCPCTLALQQWQESMQ